MAVVAFVIEGVAEVEVKLLGPVQLKVLPLAPVAVRLMVLPVQTGLLLLTVGAPGTEGLTRVNGPTEAEGQDVKVTNMLE